jgi:hypothetical protein
MRKIVIVTTALCLIMVLNEGISAQPSLFNGCSSAGVLNQPVWFNCDFPETSGIAINLNYKAQGGGSFNSVSLNRANEFPYYAFTYETSLNFANSPTILEYYFSAVRDSFMTTQSPKNADNQFPPASYKYAHFIVDPQGDMAGGSAGNWLDLRGSGMTYSDSRLYCYLQNVTGTWPLYQFPADFFAYSVGFLITSGADSAYYAFVYANVLGQLSTGLYVLDLTDSSYTRIGDINSTINGGILHMACNISAFSADPAWPGWPPPDGYIVPMGATLTALPVQLANDYTTTTVFEPRTQYLDFGSNSAPGLFSYLIEKDSGVSITPKVHYLDQDNNLPVMRRFHFDLGSFELGSPDHVYSDSSEFEAELGWPSGGWHHFYFEFSDGKDTTETALDSILILPLACEYMPGDINGDDLKGGGDVTYGVRFFKLIGSRPPDSCYMDSTGTWLYVAGDVNGNCEFRGSDITRLVAYFKLIAPLQYCHFFPPPPLRGARR